jgi:hypothetical protein
VAFRADESVNSGFESLKNYLISRGIEASERDRSEAKLLEIVEKYGPVVDGYPSWHPLIRHHDDHRCPVITPRRLSENKHLSGLNISK